MALYRPTIVVAYKKKFGSKVWIKIFNDLPCPDKIISPKSKLLPVGAEILDLGVGSGFEEKYKKKYKL
jgi:hypothetical protein